MDLRYAQCLLKRHMIWDTKGTDTEIVQQNYWKPRQNVTNTNQDLSQLLQ